ncbi:hypothetical protein ACP4OV_017113 [Aristida adscensionis]
MAPRVPSSWRDEIAPPAMEDGFQLGEADPHAWGFDAAPEPEDGVGGDTEAEDDDDEELQEAQGVFLPAVPGPIGEHDQVVFDVLGAMDAGLAGQEVPHVLVAADPGPVGEHHEAGVGGLEPQGVVFPAVPGPVGVHEAVDDDVGAVHVVDQPNILGQGNAAANQPGVVLMEQEQEQQQHIILDEDVIDHEGQEKYVPYYDFAQLLLPEDATSHSHLQACCNSDDDEDDSVDVKRFVINSFNDLDYGLALQRGLGSGFRLKKLEDEGYWPEVNNMNRLNQACNLQDCPTILYKHLGRLLTPGHDFEWALLVSLTDYIPALSSNTDLQPPNIRHAVEALIAAINGVSAAVPPDQVKTDVMAPSSSTGSPVHKKTKLDSVAESSNALPPTLDLITAVKDLRRRIDALGDEIVHYPYSP